MVTQPERWERLRQLFHQAVELPAGERRGFLDQLAGPEPEVARQLEALLAAHEEAPAFLEHGLAADVPEMAALWQAAAAGSRIGPYRVIRELGRGGMGAVYLAQRDDASFDQRVALKLIKRGMDSEEILSRFLVERQILATLTHPHIARLLDGGATEDGRPFLVMEAIDGEPIDVYCQKQALDLEERLRLFLRVADAVHFAHQHLVVHRDLKPANILVGGDGQPKLLDFGIAKLLGEGGGNRGATVAGGGPKTPDYASPEQLSGGAITTATDIHGLGILLFELAVGLNPMTLVETGRPPLASLVAGRGAGGKKLARRLAGDFDAVVAKALAPEPNERYPSVRELAADLERFLSQRPVEARRPTLTYRALSFVRRHRLASAAAAALALLGFTASVLAVALVRERLEVRSQSRRSEALATFLLNVFKVADPGTSRGETVTARELLERGTAELSRDGGPLLEPTTRAFLLTRVGEIFLSLGLYREAQKNLERSLALREASDASELERAETRQLLAVSLRDQGELAEAHRLLEEVLVVRQRLAGFDSLAVASTLSELGVVDQLGKELERGRQRLAEAISIQRAAGPEAELALATSLSTLATLELDVAERPDAAEPLTAEALSIHRRRLGEDHPETLTDLANLAGVQYRRGKFQEAEELTRQILMARQRVLGPTHPEVAETYVSLSTLARQRGDGVAAEAAARKAVELLETRGDSGQNYLDDALNNLAMILADGEKREEAEQIFRRVQALYEKNPATPDETRAVLLNNLAQLRRDQGDLAEAEKLLRRAVELWRRGLGSESRMLAQSLNSLAGLLGQRGRALEARRFYQEALAMRRKLLGPEHADVAQSLVGLGSLLLLQGQPREAEPLLAEGLEIRRRALSPGHVAIGQAEGALGHCYLRLGRLAAARPLLESSERLLAASRPPDHPEVRKARERLAELAGAQLRRTSKTLSQNMN